MVDGGGSSVGEGRCVGGDLVVVPVRLEEAGAACCRRKDGDCSSPEKPVASELSLASPEAARRRWSSRVEVGRPAGRRSSAEARHCAE
jgi:hypothetical protein